MSKHLILLALLLPVILSCETNTRSLDNAQESAPDYVPLDKALRILHEFESSFQPRTRTNHSRTIQSVDVFREEGGQPMAYLVNYADNSGYSVLGARTDVDPIIAVTEKGSMDMGLIIDSDSEDNNSHSYERMIALFLKNGIYKDYIPSRVENDDPDDNEAPPGEGPTPHGGESFTSVVPPMTQNLSFNQGRSFCHKSNGRYVISGCPAVALAIICAKNHYPTIIADGSLVDYSACTDTAGCDGEGFQYTFYKNSNNIGSVHFSLQDYFYDYQDIDTTGMSGVEKLSFLGCVGNAIQSGDNDSISVEWCSFKRSRDRLISSMFNTVDNILPMWNMTGALPNKVADALRDLGYSNVDYWTTDSLDINQKIRIGAMLGNGTPTIMCGWSLWDLDNSHYWVVDGSNMCADASMIHCNWGHGGFNNGWFSTSCIRRRHAVSYDGYHDTFDPDSTSEYNHLIVYYYRREQAVPIDSISICSQFKSYYNEN